VQPAVHGGQPGGGGERRLGAARADEGDRPVGAQPRRCRLQDRQVGHQLPADRRRKVGHRQVPERPAGPAGAERQHQVVNIGGQAGEEGTNRVPVAGVDRRRHDGAAETVRGGGEPTGIPAGDDDPRPSRGHRPGDRLPDTGTAAEHDDELIVGSHGDLRSGHCGLLARPATIIQQTGHVPSR
jgi:hypothetical protein